MKKLPLYVLGIFIFSFRPDEKIKIFLAGDSTMSIKEIKAYPETGWGMPFVYFWDSSVTIVNRAKNGRSTKTFISEGLWKSITDEAGKGDYIFIQFGHNDESVEKKERYSTPDTFKMNLNRFIKEAREKAAIPVLFTPVGRRKFDDAGKVMETHLIYAQLTRDVAIAQKVLLIDLDAMSRKLYQNFGKENSKLLFLQLKSGEHPNYPEGKEDNTHFTELGARLIAQEVLSEIRIQIPGLAAYIVKPKNK
ncbi:MAG: rhamnogalacturonan acetylesterase [Chitinophagaceae bacterium]